MRQYIDHSALIEARRARANDQSVRDALGIHYVGLYYSLVDFRAKPLEQFADRTGTTFVRIALGVYRKTVDIHRDLPTFDYKYSV